MKGEINSKIIGATVIGFALVFGAYTISNLNKPAPIYQEATALAAKPPSRIPITVTDNNTNGVEDWRDQFITTEAVNIDEEPSEYIEPDSLTGKMSVSFMQKIISSRIYAPYGGTNEDIIAETVSLLTTETKQKLYTVYDLDIMDQWDPEDVVNYANTAASVLFRNSNPDLAGELDILNDIVRNSNDSRLDELIALAGVYASYRDDTLKIPVPKILAKQHLDLINSYEAIHFDIEAMTTFSTDPAVTLLRLGRYEGDALSLGYSLENLYAGIEPYGDYFVAEDPGLFFVAFSPKYQN